MHELHLATIRAEGERLAAMPADALDAPVPHLENWTLERVVRHVGRVHRWATGLLAAPADADPDAVAAAAPALPKGPDSLPAYHEALDRLLDTLTTVDPERATASFLGSTRAAFWVRRQAHEVTVHRIDAADAVHAAGGPPPAPPAARAAADGVGEWVEVFAATRHAQLTGSVDPALRGHTIGFAVTDTDPTDVRPTAADHWTLTFTDTEPPTVTATSGRGSGSSDDLGSSDAVLTAPAGALLCTLWRRRPLAHVTVTGDEGLARVLYDTMVF